MDDFWSHFERYVRSYLPGWQYQRGGQEPEAALMTVLGEMLEESRRRLEKLPEKHQREYLSAWRDLPRPEEPMYLYAGLSAPQSVYLPKGSSFYRSGDGARLWETTEDAWAEAGRLCEQIFSGSRCGKLIQLPAPTSELPTRLFDFHPPGTQGQEVRFRHPFVFSSQMGCQASLKLEAAPDDLLRFLLDPAKCSWRLDAEEASIPLDMPTGENDTLQFRLPASGAADALLVRVRDGQTPPAASVRRALAETTRALERQVRIITDSGLCRKEGWLPFGERLIPWNICYVSCPDVLGLPGAQVTLSWTQSCQAREELLPGMEREPEYRPVMRRLPEAPPAIREVCADPVLWEYWDGFTWRAIPGTEVYTCIFSDGEEPDRRPRRLEARFQWPSDARPCPVQGVNAHWLRWRLGACEGAGWFPARHHAPVLSQLKITAALYGAETVIEGRRGMGDPFRALTDPPRKVLFPSITPEQDRWWLGFDAPPGGETLNLYLSLRGRVPGGRLSACEAVPGGGERPVFLTDETDGLSHSGMISLRGLRGRLSTRFGLERWWLCLREESGVFHGGARKPVLLSLSCGAVLLRAAGGDRCAAGEPFLPLHGGAVTGVALSDCFGGVPSESDAEVMRRLRTEHHHLGRIVSETDAEQLIRGRVRDVARVRCVRGGDTLQLGVLMRDVAHHEAAFQLKRNAIEQLVMDSSALSALGLSLTVREPCFYPIHVMVWAGLRKNDELSGAERQIKLALDQFLDPVRGNFGGTGWRMGELPTVAQIRVCLQAAAPDISLTEVVISAATPDGAEREPVSIHDPFALPLGGTCTIYTI